MSLNVSVDLAVAIPSLVAAGTAAFSSIRQGRTVRRVASDTKQLQHNGGSHVADYARDARDYAEQARDEVARLKELAERSATAAESAADLSRDARAAASRVASTVATNTRQTRQDLSAFRNAFDQHVRRADEVEAEFRGRLDDLATGGMA